jgi:hypothetical protein
VIEAQVEIFMLGVWCLEVPLGVWDAFFTGDADVFREHHQRDVKHTSSLLRILHFCGATHDETENKTLTV